MDDAKLRLTILREITISGSKAVLVEAERIFQWVRNGKVPRTELVDDEDDRPVRVLKVYNGVETFRQLD